MTRISGFITALTGSRRSKRNQRPGPDRLGRLSAIGIFALLVPMVSVAQPPMRYWFNVTAGQWPIELNFPAPVADIVFKDAKTAVNILAVSCDDVSLQPEVISPATLMDKRVIKSGAVQVVYRGLGGQPFECWSDIDAQPGHFELKTFRIPRSFSRLTVVYKIRYPSGTSSAPIEASFFCSEDLPSVFATPPATAR